MISPINKCNLPIFYKILQYPDLFLFTYSSGHLVLPDPDDFF
jgi:hypothetical protein